MNFSKLFMLIRQAFIMLMFLSARFYNAEAQSFPFHEYTVLDGLPQSQAGIVLQDSRGFLWITTRNGVSRFDGIEFTNYFRKEGLPSNIIKTIIEDSKGIIWAVSPHGLSEYDGLRFNYDQCPDSLLGENIINSCTSFNPDTLLLSLFDYKQNRGRILSYKNGIFSEYSSGYLSLDTLDSKTICYDTGLKVLYILNQKGSLYKWDNQQLKLLSEIRFNDIQNDRGRIVFISGERKYEYSKGLISELRINGGLGRVEASINTMGENDEVLLSDGNSATRIKLPFTYSGLTIDDESNLWFSTEKNIYRLITTAFSYFSEEKDLVRNVWTMAEDKNGMIWLGSLFGELQEFDGNKFNLRNDYRTAYGGKGPFYRGSIRASDGKVYFSLGNGVLLWDGLRFSRLRSMPVGTQVCIIYEDPVDKSLFFGTDKGLFHLKDNVMTSFPQLTSSSLGVVEGVLRAGDDKYWLSGEKGLVFMDGKNFSPARDSILPGGYTFTLVSDYRGGIWVTSEEGLFYKPPDNQPFRRGLPETMNISANSIRLMDSTHILVGRITDICILSLDKFYNNDPDYFKVYDKSDGFTGSDCMDNGIIKDKSGKFWILTSGKVVIMDPLKLKPNLFPPRNYVTGIDFLSDSAKWVPLNVPGLFYGKNDEIKLTRKERSIRIRFIGISLTNPEKVKYRYRLIGRDDTWSELISEREALYENLSPGNYSFQLRSFNSDGIESNGICSLNFRLVPTFWQTLFFKIMSGIIIVILISFLTWLSFRRYERRKDEEERKKSELARLQMNSVIGQFDSHFTFNVLSSVGSLIMKGEKESAYDYILKLSGLLRSSLSDGSVMIRSVSEELDFVKKYCDLQKLRYKERFRCSLEMDSNVDISRDIPRMTIQTFVENSIKHGIENRKEGGTITIRLSEANNCLEITVKDDGIGRKAALAGDTAGPGLGIRTISNIFEYLNRLNRNKAEIKIDDLYHENGDPAGTVVRIIIPDDFIFRIGSDESA